MSNYRAQWCKAYVMGPVVSLLGLAIVVFTAALLLNYQQLPSLDQIVVSGILQILGCCLFSAGTLLVMTETEKLKQTDWRSEDFE